MKDLLQTVKLQWNAWYGDTQVDLDFPSHWQVQVFGEQALPAMSENEILSAFRNPIGTSNLGKLAAGKRSAAILLDDLERPTPVGFLLAITLHELIESGMDPHRIKVLVSGGTHRLSQAECVRKLEVPLPPDVQVIQNDCHHDQVYIGESGRGTPIWVNKAVFGSDLKIGIGCILPHPAAGFSGGSKLLALGAGGYDTIRTIHDQRAAAKVRGGSIDCEFRQDVEQIAAQIGLDFILNAVLNQQREITRLFCGHRWLAFEKGVAYVKKYFQVPSPPEDADVVITDFYPCDTTMQQGFDRGLWPLMQAPVRASKVAVTGCPGGKGVHELFPVSNPFAVRLLRRMRHLRWADFLSLGARIQALKRTLNRRKIEVLIFSPGLSVKDAQASLPRSMVYPAWDGLQSALIKRHERAKKVKVVIYRCASLMLPEIEQV